MADKKAKTVEFDLFPSKYSVDDDLPPDQAELKAALFGDKPLDTDEDDFGTSPIAPSVTTFPRIRAEYLSDKVGSVKRSIAPYHNPDDLEKEFGDMPIEEMLNWNDSRNERIESMWEDPEFAFIKMVEGAAIDNTLGMRRSMTQERSIPRPTLPNIQIDRSRGQECPPQGRIANVRTGATGQGFSGIQERTESERPGPLLPESRRGQRPAQPSTREERQPPPSFRAEQPRELPRRDIPYIAPEPTQDPGEIGRARIIGGTREMGASIPGRPETIERFGEPGEETSRERERETIERAPAFDPWRDERRERERIDILRTVRREAERPEVSGRMQMSDQLQSQVEKSLADLAQYNFEKFSGKTKEHFFNDKTAMRLFANLTAANVALAKIRAPKRYYHDKDTERRLSEIKRFVQQIDSDLMWSPREKAFVVATPEVRRQNLSRGKLPPSMRRRGCTYLY